MSLFLAWVHTDERYCACILRGRSLRSGDPPGEKQKERDRLKASAGAVLCPRPGENIHLFEIGEVEDAYHIINLEFDS